MTANTFTYDGSRLLAQRPDGSVMFDTNERMPALIGDVTFNNVVMDMNNSDWRILTSGSKFFFHQDQAESTQDFVLGDGPAVAPDFVMCMIRVNWTSPTGIIFVNVVFNFMLPLTTTDYIPLNGSLLLQTWQFGARVLTLVAEGGKWIMRKRDEHKVWNSSQFSFVTGVGLRQIFNMDIRIAWGVVDV